MSNNCASMNAATEEATVQALRKVYNELHRAAAAFNEAQDSFKTFVILVRRNGYLSVNDMAKTLDQDRNYVDRIWSERPDHPGLTARGTPTQYRVNVVTDPAVQDSYRKQLKDAYRKMTTADSELDTARSERNRTVAAAYASKILGPSMIASVVGIDRNHVLRIARSHGVGPVHRAVSRNQYSKPNDASKPDNASKPGK